MLWWYIGFHYKPKCMLRWSSWTKRLLLILYFNIRPMSKYKFVLPVVYTGMVWLTLCFFIGQKKENVGSWTQLVTSLSVFYILNKILCLHCCFIEIQECIWKNEGYNWKIIYYLFIRNCTIRKELEFEGELTLRTWRISRMRWVVLRLLVPELVVLDLQRADGRVHV